MKDRLNYRGCTAIMKFDPNDHFLVGRVLHIEELIPLHAESLAEFTEAFHEAVDDYLATCERPQRRCEEPPPWLPTF